jgi:Tfp pilus assembly protein PilV
MGFKRLNKTKKGVTLIEVMIYSLLVGIVLTGVYGTLIFSLRYFQTINTISSLQDSVLITLSKIETEMSETRAAAITVSTSPPGVMFPTLKNTQNQYLFNNNGQAMWQGWASYYLQTNEDGTKNLVMKKVNLSTPRAVNPGIPPYSSVAQFASANVAPQLISRNVNHLKIEPGSSINNFRIAITAELVEDQSKPNSITAETELMFRN